MSVNVSRTNSDTLFFSRNHIYILFFFENKNKMQMGSISSPPQCRRAPAATAPTSANHPCDSAHAPSKEPRRSAQYIGAQRRVLVVDPRESLSSGAEVTVCGRVESQSWSFATLTATSASGIALPWAAAEGVVVGTSPLRPARSCSHDGDADERNTRARSANRVRKRALKSHATSWSWLAARLCFAGRRAASRHARTAAAERRRRDHDMFATSM